MSGGSHGGGRKKKGHEEEEDLEISERWMVTYADMLTLLFVLFVVLFAMSSVDQAKLKALSSSLASAFNGGQPTLMQGSSGLQSNAQDSTIPKLQPLDMAANIAGALPKSDASSTASASATATPPTSAQTQAAEFAAVQKALADALAAAGMPGAATTQVDSRGLVITVVTTGLVFPGNSADLLAAGQSILNVVAPTIANLPNHIEVDGYTNQLQVSTGSYASGWELSADRASAVVRFLAVHGVAETRLSAVGWSDQKPLFPASDPRSVTQNRRVEIVVLSAT